MKVSKTVNNLLFGLFLALCSGIGCSTTGYQADPTSALNALARGEAKEFLSAMEARAAEAESKGNWLEAARSYNEATWAAQSSGQLQKANSYASKALGLAESARDIDAQVRAIFFLSSVHTSLRQYEKGREWIEKGLVITKRMPSGLRSEERRVGKECRL